jgi:hypothetical protein
MTALSGMKDVRPAAIDRREGGAFSLFGGVLIGRHVELVANQRFVQAWRETKWDPGVCSLVKFNLVPQGAGTLIVFDHTAFPMGAAAHAPISRLGLALLGAAQAAPLTMMRRPRALS